MKRLSAALLCLGCSSASMAGGSLVVHDDEPRGEALGQFHVGDCADGRGGKVAGPSSAVRVLRRQDGHLLLVDSRERDALAVDNVRDDGTTRTFQAIVVRKSGVRTLREYRVPDAPGSPGTFALARDFEVRNAKDGFVASYAAPALMCALLPEGPPGDIPTPP